ncbi:hypothetical protein FF011L_23790 [Roseimaritima multifibrata]|uniref:Uncharacterized protein n=1 Tax=Roseimaritima multifibrata TaxID=1930274 RepID=A0A517MFI6_9BACT|nr:hypothetical protein FF011L_23790 [Roseimaritima multifibrata]
MNHDMERNTIHFCASALPDLARLLKLIRRKETLFHAI